ELLVLRRWPHPGLPVRAHSAEAQASPKAEGQLRELQVAPDVHAPGTRHIHLRGPGVQRRRNRPDAGDEDVQDQEGQDQEAQDLVAARPDLGAASQRGGDSGEAARTSPPLAWSSARIRPMIRVRGGSGSFALLALITVSVGRSGPPYRPPKSTF